MYELCRAGEHTYYIDGPTKVGIVELGGGEVCLIDSGNDKTAGKRTKRILDAQGWHLAMILSTHSHADHIGGNRYLQTQTGCPAFAPGSEQAFSVQPELEAALLYGGHAPAQLRHKFLKAQASDVQILTSEVLPHGMELIPLPGHSFGMVGFRTPDNVVFLADCLSGERAIEGYRIVYVYDVAAYLQTLEQVERIQAALFVPAHADATTDIAPLARRNIEMVYEVANDIEELCTQAHTSEELLEGVFDRYGIPMTFEQHALVGFSMRSYLSWLQDQGRIAARIEGHRWLWQKV